MTTLNLYEKIGGAQAVSKVVRNFYDIILEDEGLKKYFKNISMAGLIAHQIEFISSALGKPSEYTGKDMISAHKGFKITNSEFSRICEILNHVLKEAGVGDGDIKKIELIVISLKNDIVGH